MMQINDGSRVTSRFRDTSVYLLFSLLLLLPGPLAAEEKGLDLTLWHVLETSTLVDDVVAEFGRQSGHRVDALPYNTDRAKGDLVLNALSGTMPDAILVPSDFLGLHGEYKLEALDDSWLHQDTAASTAETTVLDGERYGVPVIAGNFLVLYFNRRLVSEVASSWAQLAGQRQPIERGGARLIVWNYEAPYWFAPFLGAFDGRVLDGRRFTLDTPQMVLALDFYGSLQRGGIIERNCDYECTAAEFRSGKAAYAINGDWAFHEYSRQLGDDLGIAALPTIDGKIMRSMSSTYALAFPMLSRDPARREALRAFALHFQGEQMQRHMFERYRHLPVNQVVFKQLLETAEGRDRALLEQRVNTVTMPSIPEMAIAWNAIDRAARLYYDGQFDAEQAAEHMQSLAEKELARR